jgi:hypothetical protein
LLAFLSFPIFLRAYRIESFVHDHVQTEITVQFSPVSGASHYQLSWKEYPAPWSSAQSKTVKASAAPSNTKVAAEGLEPGTTYCVRLMVIDPASGTKGDTSKELVLDTEQVGCTPTDNKSCCTIL